MGRTRLPTCIFIKNNAFRHTYRYNQCRTGRTQQINEFQYILDTPGRETATSSYNESTQSLPCLISIPTGTKYQYGIISSN